MLKRMMKWMIYQQTNISERIQNELKNDFENLQLDRSSEILTQKISAIEAKFSELEQANLAVSMAVSPTPWLDQS